MTTTQTALVDAPNALRSMDEASDESLMQSYASGDETSLAVLIRRYERELYSYLRRMVVDAGLAEDIFQNTFMQLHQKRHLYEFGRPVRPWLYTIATHQAIDALRRFNRHRRVKLCSDADRREGRAGVNTLDNIASASNDPLVDCERNERARLVRKTLDSLADHLRVVVLLGYYQGLKYKEIADILGIPVGTVKSRLHAAITKLGEVWEKNGLTME